MMMSKTIDESKPEPTAPDVHAHNNDLGEGQSCQKTKDCQKDLECQRSTGKKCVKKPGLSMCITNEGIL